MVAENSTTSAELLLEQWTQDELIEELFKEKGTFPLIPKDTEFYEEKRHLIVGTSANQGGSATFDVAKEAKGIEGQVEFVWTLKSYFQMFSIDRLARKRSTKKRGSIVNILDRKSRNALYTLRRRNNIYLWNTGRGDLGTVSSFTGSAITLTTAGTHRFFESGMLIETAPSGSPTTVNAGRGTISTMQRAGGATTTSKINTTVALATCMPNIANGDLVYIAGDCNKVYHGIPGHIPYTAPTSGDSWGGVDRSTKDIPRVCGIRTDGSTLGPREGFMLLLKDVDEGGPGMPDLGCFSSTDYYNLTLELQSAGFMQTTRMPSAPINGVSFGMEYEDVITVNGPRKKVKLISDADIPPGYAWALELDKWLFATCGELVQIITPQGHMEENADSEEFRFAIDGELYCEAPGNQGVVYFG